MDTQWGSQSRSSTKKRDGSDEGRGRSLGTSERDFGINEGSIAGFNQDIQITDEKRPESTFFDDEDEEEATKKGKEIIKGRDYEIEKDTYHKTESFEMRFESSFLLNSRRHPSDARGRASQSDHFPGPRLRLQFEAGAQRGNSSEEAVRQYLLLI